MYIPENWAFNSAAESDQISFINWEQDLSHDDWFVSTFRINLPNSFNPLLSKLRRNRRYRFIIWKIFITIEQVSASFAILEVTLTEFQDDKDSKIMRLLTQRNDILYVDSFWNKFPDLFPTSQTQVSGARE